ncbi:hypothetical protein [Sphingopyxis sp. Root1497]
MLFAADQPSRHRTRWLAVDKGRFPVH